MEGSDLARGDALQVAIKGVKQPWKAATWLAATRAGAFGRRCEFLAALNRTCAGLESARVPLAKAGQRLEG